MDSPSEEPLKELTVEPSKEPGEELSGEQREELKGHCGINKVLLLLLLLLQRSYEGKSGTICGITRNTD